MCRDWLEEHKYVAICNNMYLPYCSIWITTEIFLVPSRIWTHRCRVMQLMKQALYLQATTDGSNYTRRYIHSFNYATGFPYANEVGPIQWYHIATCNISLSKQGRCSIRFHCLSSWDRPSKLVVEKLLNFKFGHKKRWSLLVELSMVLSFLLKRYSCTNWTFSLCNKSDG